MGHGEGAGGWKDETFVETPVKVGGCVVEVGGGGKGGGRFDNGGASIHSEFWTTSVCVYIDRQMDSCISVH